MKKALLIYWLTIAAVWSPLPSRAQVPFPYPEIPASMEDGQTRLAYVLDHFWDAYSFADTTTVNRQLGEQGMADYLNLLPHAEDPAVQQRAVRDFVGRAFATGADANYFEELLDRYLAHSGSPQRNEELYVLFLQRMADALPGDDVRAERFRQQVRLLTMNRKGEQATDFRYVTRTGEHHHLTEVSAPYTLLVFSDPDCHHCRATLPGLIASETLRDSRLRVLLVYPDDDAARWERETRELPPNWSDVRSPEGEVLHRPLYHLPSLPALYLLDSDKRILVKDGTLEEVERMMVRE